MKPLSPASIVAVAFSLLTLHAPALAQVPGPTTQDASKPASTAKGMTAMSFVQAPIPISSKCSSVIVQGNAGMEFKYFVLPRGVMGVDRAGNKAISLTPPQSRGGSWRLRIGLYFPKDINAALSAQKMSDDYGAIAGCNFNRIEKDLNRDFWMHLEEDPDRLKQYGPLREKYYGKDGWLLGRAGDRLENSEFRMFKLLPAHVTSVQASIPGLPGMPAGVMAISKDKTGVLDLYSDMHYLEFHIPQSTPAAWDALKTFIDDFNVGPGGSQAAKGVELSLDIGFSANKRNGEMHCEYRSASAESNLRLSLKGRPGALVPGPAGEMLNMAKINFKNEIANSTKNQGLQCSGDASTSEQFNAFGMAMATALISDDTFLPKMAQAQAALSNMPPMGGLPPALPPLFPGAGGPTGTPLPPCVDPTGNPISEEEFARLNNGAQCQDLNGMSDQDKLISMKVVMSKIEQYAKKKADLVWNAIATDETFTTSVILKGTLERPWDVPARVASTPEYKDSIQPLRTGIIMGKDQWVIIKPLVRQWSVYDYSAPVKQRYMTESEIKQLTYNNVQFGPSVAKARPGDVVPKPLPGYQGNPDLDEVTYPTYPFNPAETRLDLRAGQGRIAFKLFERNPTVNTTPQKLQPIQRDCDRGKDTECQPSRIFGYWNGGASAIGTAGAYNATKTRKAGGMRGLDIGFLKDNTLTQREPIPNILVRGQQTDGPFTATAHPAGDGWGIKIVANQDLGELVLYNTDEHDCVKMDGNATNPGHCVKSWRQRAFVEHIGGTVYVPWSMTREIFRRVQSPYIVGAPPLYGKDYTDAEYPEGWVTSYRDDRFKDFLDASSSVIVTKIDVKEDAFRDPLAFVAIPQQTTTATAPAPSGGVQNEVVPPAIVIPPANDTTGGVIPPAAIAPPPPLTKRK